MNKIFYTTLFIFSTISVANEVSVFGAGNLNSEKPYGLTSTEKYILKNKKELGSIDTKVKGVRTTIESLNERIDGLESIYEGDSQKLNSHTMKLSEIVSNLEATTNLTDVNKDDIQSVKTVANQLLNMQEEIATENKNNIDALKLAIENLTKLVNGINSNYVSSKELESNMKQFVTQKEFKSRTTIKKKTNKTANTSNFSSKSKKDLMIEARALFKKDYFTKAIPILDYLLKANYRPAESNYLLGEISYYRKKYKNAISYFKTSAILYDKAKYMPKLLLHSAISFEKTNDLTNARSFYNSIIDVYPDSNEATTAVNNLASIS
jgi:TolA-binding protein